MFIKDSSAWINVEIACLLFGLTRSAYYAWLGDSERRRIAIIKHQTLICKVLAIYVASKRRYGATRIVDKLKSDTVIGYKKVAQIMEELNIKAIGAPKYKVTTNSKHNHRVFDNLLKQDFNMECPNQAWVSDISYIPTFEGWLYLATVIDLYSRKVIAHKTSNRMTKELVIATLSNALKARNNPKHVIVHTDRGSQYASNEYKKLLANNHLLGSMSSKGNCYDNAVAESFFATIKKEYIYQTTFITRAQAQLGIFDYIETWYNSDRMHSYLNNMCPNEYEAQYRPKISNDIMLQSRPIDSQVSVS